MARAQLARRTVLVLERHRPLPALLVIASGDEGGAGPVVQLQALDVSLEPIRQLILRDIDREGRRERHVGQVVDVRLVVQRQRVIALAPVVADARMAVDNQRIDAQLPEPRGDRQPGLAAADNEDGGIAVFVGARSVAAVEPVLGAEIAGAVRIVIVAPFERFFVAADFLQVGRKRPRQQLPGRLRVGHQPRHAGAKPDGGVEGEQGLDAVRAGAADPARRRTTLRDMKMRWLRACERLAQRRLDGRAPTHALDIPGERQDVAPQAVGLEQCGCCCGVLRAKRRFKAFEPALRGLGGGCARYFDDVHIVTSVRKGSRMWVPAQGGKEPL